MPKMCTVATHAERGAPEQRLCRTIGHVVLRFECDGSIPPAFMNCPAGWTAIKCIPALQPLPVMMNNSVQARGGRESKMRKDSITDMFRMPAVSPA